ncbi:MAG: M28 family peptidase [Bacteroidetes bacterium]|nr:MAG: M28 family peptidase [Bacteroidota bacterium]
MAYKPITCLALMLTAFCTPSHTQQPQPLSLEQQRTALAGRPKVATEHLTDSGRLMERTAALSATDMEGRLVGTAGGAKARAYIIAQLEKTSAKPLAPNWQQPFTYTRAGSTVNAVNVLGIIRGTKQPDSVLVLSAHYDHLGVKNGKTYHGADDNASGVATLLEAASYFTQHPPQHSMVFCFFDAEESGLKGAFHFVGHLPEPLQLNSIKVNINLDMVSRNHVGNELIAVGTLANPHLKPILAKAQPLTNIALLFGHEGEPGTTSSDNWIVQSDQAAFAAKKVAYIYLGVEDHPDYHQPTDTFEHINKPFFYASSNLIMRVLLLLDEHL